MTNFQCEFTTEEMRLISGEFNRLGESTYLDHAGTTLYSEAQIDNVAKTLKENLFCNPHTCKMSGDLVDQVRYRILKHFNTNANDYTVIFTSGTTASLKIVAETFDFKETGSFYYCQENHTSVLGMRDVVRTDNIYVLRKDELEESLANCNGDRSSNANVNSLVTFSAQCNFSGYKMPLELIGSIHRNGLMNRGKPVRNCNTENDKNQMFVCLDAAAFVATNFLDLKKYPADFVCLSFYKIFGYPTGLGALLVSKRGQKVLNKQYYGGGTVKIAMTLEDFHEKRDGLSQRFEDGTLSFLGVAGLLEGFRTHDRLVVAKEGVRPIERISNHVYQLAKYCYESFTNLKHSNGKPLVKFYNHTQYTSKSVQGGVCTFNILHDDGTYVGFAEVACIAAIYNVLLRTGCFCNPGACQALLGLSNEDIRSQYQAGHICSDYNDLIDGIPTGAIRVSFGYMTRKEDVDRVVEMIKENYLTENNTHRINILANAEDKLPKALKHIPGRIKNSNEIRLRKICIYPIKSCGSYDISTEWELTDHGLKYDRTWMIIDSNGMAVTQKTTSRMCMIKPRVDLETSELEIRFPGSKSIRIPLDSISHAERIQSTMCQSKVCGDLVEGSDCGNDVADWISEALEISGLRLIKQETERRTKSGSSKDINLSNQAQFLLVNYTSVSWLSGKVENWDEIEREDLDSTVDRFRGNLLIETPEPLDENQFTKLTIGNVDFKIDGFCTRCQMICVDQKTGVKTTEPLKTIARVFQGKIRFGIYLSLEQMDGKTTIISCNDKVCIVK